MPGLKKGHHKNTMTEITFAADFSFLTGTYLIDGAPASLADNLVDDVDNWGDGTVHEDGFAGSRMFAGDLLAKAIQDCTIIADLTMGAFNESHYLLRYYDDITVGDFSDRLLVQVPPAPASSIRDCVLSHIVTLTSLPSEFTPCRIAYSHSAGLQYVSVNGYAAQGQVPTAPDVPYSDVALQVGPVSRLTRLRIIHAATDAADLPSLSTL